LSEAEKFLFNELSACSRAKESKRKVALRAMLVEVRLDGRRFLDAADLVEHNLATGRRFTFEQASTYARVCRALLRARHQHRARSILRKLIGLDLPVGAAVRDLICAAANAWKTIPSDLSPIVERYLEGVIKNLGIDRRVLRTHGPLRERVLSACAAYRAAVDRYSDFLCTPHPVDPLERRAVFARYTRSEPVRFFREEAWRTFKRD
jgi:hypothetical protein